MTHLPNSNSASDSFDEPTLKIASVLAEVLEERLRQEAQWGEQNHPDGTGKIGDSHIADLAKVRNDAHVAEGILTFRDILEEEVFEAFAESDPDRLREELIQVAAVAGAWVEAIDRRRS